MIRLVDANVVNTLTAHNPVFILIDQNNGPVLVVANANNGEVKLADLAKCFFGNLPANVAFLDIPFDELSSKKCLVTLLNSRLGIVKKSQSKDQRVKEKKHHKIFTSREIEILRLISLEFTNDEIASKLCLAKRTVDNHRVNLMQRVNVRNTAGLIGYAFRNGIIV